MMSGRLQSCREALQLLPRIYQSGCLQRHVSTGTAAITSPLHYVDGKRMQASNNNSQDDIPVLYPATGETLCSMRCANSTDVNDAVQNAKSAFKSWSKFSGSQRGRILHKASQLMRANHEELVHAEVKDTGKPIWEVRFDMEGCADSMEYYAGLAATIAGEHLTLPDGSFAYTRREPLGVCGGIGAWNYPIHMACWKSAPALACGNTMVFKPSQLTPLTAVMLAEIYSEAGLPAGVFNVVQGAAETGQLLSSHPDIAKMSFTGSLPVGSKVMEACAKDIKHVTLELGGKSPLIIFSDANLDNAVKGALKANFLAQGQVCSNGTRVFVQKDIMKPFLEKLTPVTKAMKIGDPFQDDTHVGAMISQAQAERVLQFIDIAKKEGANVIYGGERVVPSSEFAGGHFISPCILDHVTDDMTIARQEVFGSVMSVFDFETEEEVTSRANDTEFGLAGGVFTRDLNRAHRVVANLEAGSLYINNYNMCPVELPYGGLKKSGIGRENGQVPIQYYTQVKAVYVEMNDVWCPYMD